MASQRQRGRARRFGAALLGLPGCAKAPEGQGKGRRGKGKGRRGQRQDGRRAGCQGVGGVGARR
jgi:hypothetical protein